MSELANLPRQLYRKLRDFIHDPIGNKIIAGGILGLMIVYIIGGFSALFWVLLGAAVVWFWPRARQRLTRWWLLR